MAGIEHARGKALESDALPYNEISDALEWMRLTYTLDYSARPDSWQRPEDYPQSWTVSAYIDEQMFEAEDDALQGNSQGQVAVAEARVYLIPDVGEVSFFETLDAHSAELCQFAEAFIAAGSEPNQLTIEGERVLEGDLMIVSWVAVQPRFRGHRAGHQVLKAILQAAGRSTAVTALHAAPGLGEGMEEGSLQHRIQCKALAKYWGELGFRPLHRNIMLLTPDDLLDDDQADDDEVDVEALRHVPLMQLSEKERDAVFRNVRAKLEE